MWLCDLCVSMCDLPLRCLTQHPLSPIQGEAPTYTLPTIGGLAHSSMCYLALPPTHHPPAPPPLRPPSSLPSRLHCCICHEHILSQPGKQGLPCAGCHRWYHVHCCPQRRQLTVDQLVGKQPFFHCSSCNQVRSRLLHQAQAAGSRAVDGDGERSFVLLDLSRLREDDKGSREGERGGGAEGGRRSRSRKHGGPRDSSLPFKPKVRRKGKPHKAAAAEEEEEGENAEGGTKGGQAGAAVGVNEAVPGGPLAPSTGPPRLAGAPAQVHSPSRAEPHGLSKAEQRRSLRSLQAVFESQWPGDEGSLGGEHDALDDDYSLSLLRGGQTVCAATFNVHGEDHARLQVRQQGACMRGGFRQQGACMHGGACPSAGETAGGMRAWGACPPAGEAAGGIHAWGVMPACR